MKKKIIAIIAVVLAIAGVAAFVLVADPFHSDTPDGPDAPTVDTTPTGPVEITEEAIRSHPATPAKDFTYEKDEAGTGIIITGYRGTDPIVVIPETIAATPVVSIAMNAFGFESSVKGMMLPDSLKTTDHAAFMNNLSLEILIWEGATAIQTNTFACCGNLRELVLGEDVCFVADNSFFACSALTIKVVPGSYMETYCKDHNLAYTTE